MSAGVCVHCIFIMDVNISAGGSPMLESDKPGSSVVDIQCLLDNVGTTELVIDLIVNTKNDRVFEESILLGIALLQGGSTQIQVGDTDTIFPHLRTQPITQTHTYSLIHRCGFSLITALLPSQNSFYSQLYKQKKSERFFKVFYDRMRSAQLEIRATVSVNMFELSCRKRDDDGDLSGIRFKKGKVNH